MSERDPRVNPRPGDVVLGKDAASVVSCIKSTSKRVHYQIGPLRAVNTMPITEWRRWAKDAEVIHKADTE